MESLRNPESDPVPPTLSPDLGQDLSFSMMIDEGALHSSTDDIPHKPPNFSNLQKRMIHTWVRDESVVSCYSCETSFSLFVRKHHCRACGRVFCYGCSNYWVSLPESRRFFPRPPEAGLFDSMKKMMNRRPEDEVRVCRSCHEKIIELTSLEQLIRVFESTFDLQELNQILPVSKMYYKAGVYCLSQFREIQYKLPSQPFTKTERHSLWRNRHLMAGHNLWLVQLIRSVEWDRNNSLDPRIAEIMELIKAPKKQHCWNLMCTRRCRPEFRYLELAQLLSERTLPDKLLGFLLNYLEDYPLPLVSATLPLLRTQLLSELGSNTRYLTQKLIQLSVSERSLMIDLVNDVMVMRESATQEELIKLDQLFWSLINGIKRENLASFQRLDQILGSIRKLRQLQNQSLPQIKQLIAKHFNGFQSYRLPIHAEKQFSQVELNEIEIKDSYQKPMVIPFRTVGESSETIKIMCKQDDIRPDYIIQKLISLMAYLIQQELGFDPEIITYQVIPLTRNFGMIEMVEDCETIYNITQKFTVQNYIMEHNPESTVQEIRERFIRSTAAYSVITYLLGVGDRHLDNIMIHHSGSLFHIDYGYILGSDPKLTDPTVRISPHMLDAMGGMESDHYRKFQETCSQIYNTLRQHVSLIAPLMATLFHINPVVYRLPKIEQEILRRFEPGVSQPDARCHLTNLMNRSHSHRWRYKLIDIVHSGIKKSSRWLGWS